MKKLKKLGAPINRQRSPKVIPRSGEYYWVEVTFPDNPRLKHMLIGMYFLNEERHGFWRIDGVTRPESLDIVPHRFITRPTKRVMK